MSDEEIDALVEEVDDWIRVGNHVRLVTTVGRTLIDIDGERIMRTEHHLSLDAPPADWARRAARIIADLRSQRDLARDGRLDRLAALHIGGNVLKTGPDEVAHVDSCTANWPTRQPILR